MLAAPRAVDVAAAAAEIPTAETGPGSAGWADGLAALRRDEPAPDPLGRPGEDALAVVIDVLRATSTLAVALEHGAAAVIAAATVEEARALAAARPGALLCGEREGRVIPGFDLGNSPLEYSRERVAGKTLVFASTNGSQALRFAARAKARVPGAFLNAGAAIERAARADAVWLIASGKLGTPAIEDVACAGWMARALLGRGFAPADSATRFAISIAPEEAAGVRALVEGCSHAAVLAALGPEFARDIEYCATLDARRGAFEI